MGTGADLPFPIEKQAPRLRSALGDKPEAAMADKAGLLNLRSACCCSRQKGQPSAPQPNGLICMIAARSSNLLRLGHQRKGRSWLSCSTTPFTR